MALVAQLIEDTAVTRLALFSISTMIEIAVRQEVLIFCKEIDVLRDDESGSGDGLPGKSEKTVRPRLESACALRLSVGKYSGKTESPSHIRLNEISRISRQDIDHSIHHGEILIRETRHSIDGRLRGRQGSSMDKPFEFRPERIIVRASIGSYFESSTCVRTDSQ